jgi:phosphonate transport system ATP-binding protein
VELKLETIGLTLEGGHCAIQEVSLEFTRGDRVAVIGPSGAGKTSLLRVISAALKPSPGTLRIEGLDPWTLSRGTLRRLRSRIGMVYQTPPLPPRQRVVTAVLAGRLGQWSMWKSFASLAYPADIRGAQVALERVVLAERLFDRCDRLSGGQLQRVGVARVLYQQPDLILADEPVSSLDPQLADRVIGELNRECIARSVTLVASLHAVDLALRWFPRVIGLRNGLVAFDLPPVKISAEMLTGLYASESPVPPTQDNRLLELPIVRLEPVTGAKRPLCP